MWRAARRFGPVAIILVLLAAAVGSGVFRELSLGELQSHRQLLTAFVREHPVESVGLYFAVYLLVVVACIPGPGLMSIAGGFLFGVWLGGAAALASCVTGSAFVFMACRTAFGDWAAHRAGPMVQRIEAGFSSNAFPFLLTLRLVPMVPFFVVNVATGLARIRLSTLVAATVVGTAPAAFVFAGLGSGLGVLFDRGVKADMGLVERPEILLPLAGLALLGAGPLAWRFWRRPRKQA
jgi:uncharacterized membrane protein YdjX (TVP38/TMEM64 family)